MKSIIRKIIVCILCFSIGFIVCNGIQMFKKVKEEDVTYLGEEDVTYVGIVDMDEYYLNLKPDQGVIDDYVIDEELALKIGTEVIRSALNQSEEGFGDLVISMSSPGIFELKDKDVYVVYRAHKNDKILDCGYSVAIDKNTGAIKRVWMG